MNWEDFGSKIRAERIKKGMTQQELAEIVEVTAESISYYETGKKRPSFEKMKIICNTLGISMDNL